jgi:hypothetical protein
MRAMIERIRPAAYARWEYRGRIHGFDREDWMAAEGQELLARIYRIVAADRLDADSPRAIGSANRRRCRFCDQGEPRVAFDPATPVFPSSFGPGAPIAFDQCRECLAQFGGGIDAALARFVGLGSARSATRDTIPVDAFKGLTKLALAVMPASDLDDHEETRDWVANPEHDFDLNVFHGLACVVHDAPKPFPACWSALARREQDDEPWPSMLFFLGIGNVVYQIAVPMGQRDDDLDVPISAFPGVIPPCPFGLGFDPIGLSILPMVACGRERVLLKSVSSGLEYGS